MAKIPLDEIEAYIPDEPGFVRINHNSDTCSGSSKSLKIERKEDGTISAYCFRCGDSVRVYPSFQRAKARTNGESCSASRLINSSTNISRPRDSTTETSNWSQQARSWLRSYGVTNDEILKYGISYSPSYNSLSFSVIDSTNIYDGGFICRTFQEGKPKWLSFSRGKQWYSRSSNPEKKNVLVLVEDVVSAILVNRYVDCVALLTTTISNDTLIKIANYDEYIIWLDNDNKTVKLNQAKLAKRLSLFGKVRVIHETDPKNMDERRIIEFIK